MIHLFQITKKTFFYLAFFTVVSTSIYSQKQFNLSEAQKFVKGSSEVILNDKRNTVSYVKFDKGLNVKREEHANWLKNEICKTGTDSDFKIYKTEEDILKVKHYIYKQYYRGYPVEFSGYNIHTKNEAIIKANGECYSNIAINSASIDSVTALNYATSYFSKKISRENQSMGTEKGSFRVQPKIPDNQTNATIINESEKKSNLTILPIQDKFILCYKFILFSPNPLARYTIYVDASSGEVVYSNSLIHNSDITVSVPTFYRGTQTITADYNSSTGIYKLKDNARNITTVNNNHTYGTTVTDFTSTSPTTWPTDNAAYDIHWGLEKTYDYYLNVYSRNSFDGNGSAIIGNAHYGDSYYNAFWSGSQMYFGDGTNNNTPLTSLDITGHELTHAVTQYSILGNGLQYQGESGALNESFSDIFGVTIDFYTDNAHANWIIGEAMTGTPLRDMSNPAAYGQPDTYKGTNWVNTTSNDGNTGTSDNGGVHTNSGVQNYWFYLLTNGGTGKSITDKTVTGIGITEAAKIVYQTLTVYLTNTNATYMDARNASINAAVDLYGGCSPEVIAVTNAWYCVGVGAPYVTNPTITSVVDTANCAGGSVKLTLRAKGAGTINWYTAATGGSAIASGASYTTPYISATTTYYVDASNACGTTSTPRKAVVATVTVGSGPTLTVSPANSTICLGSSVNITASGSASSYRWLPETGLDNPSTNSVVASPLANTTYTVIGKAANGCLSWSNATVNITQLTTVDPTVKVVDPVTGYPTDGGVCNNASITLQANGMDTYTWTPTTYLNNVNLANPTATVFNPPYVGQGTANPRIPKSYLPITYTITGTKGSCVNSKTLILHINPGFDYPIYSATPPNPNFTYDAQNLFSLPTRTICAGDSVYLQAHSSMFTTNQSYLSQSFMPVVDTWTPMQDAEPIWNGSDPHYGYVNKYLLVYPKVTTTYTLQSSSDINGCPVANCFFKINVNPSIYITPSRPTTICNGSSITLTANGSSSYSWMPGGATTNSITVSPGSTTTYTVTGNVQSAGCSVSRTMQVTVVSTSTITSPSTAAICSGGTVNIPLTANVPSSFTWKASDNANTTGESLSAQTTATLSNTIINTTASAQTVTYTVTPTPLVGSCSGVSQIITVTVYPAPTITSAASATICSGASVGISLTANVASSYSWLAGDNPNTTGESVTSQTATTINDVIVNTTATNQTISYTVTPFSTAVGCSGAVQVVTITVKPQPVLTVNSFTVCSAVSTTLTASGANSYSWSTEATTNTITVAPNTTSIYTVTGTGANNCSSVKTATVTVFSPTVTPVSPTICNGESLTLNASGAASYSWSTGETTSAITVTPNTTTSYTVAGTTNGCSTAGKTIVIATVKPTNITVTPTSFKICKGSFNNVTATGADKYVWNPTTELAISSLGDVASVWATSSRTYTVSGSSTCFTNSSATFTVTVIQPVTVNSATICSGNTATLTASLATSYSWSTGQTTQSIPVSPSATASYTVTVNNNGCSTTATSMVTVLSAPPVASVNSTTICVGTSTILTANGLATYNWNTGATTQSISVSPAISSTYSVSGTTICGTNSTATATVTVLPTKTVTVSSNLSSICQGASALLTANGASSYSWSPPAGLSSTTGTQVTATPTVTTTYTVMSSDGCSNKTTVTINVKPASISVSPTVSYIYNGCFASVWASGADTYTWTPSATLSLNSSKTNASVWANATTTYTVSGSSSCFINSSATFTVYVVPPVVVNSATICSGNIVTLNASNGNYYDWSTGDQANSITVAPATTTTYTVTGHVGGCSSSAISVVSVIQPTITVNSSSICVGNSTVLTASAASSYSWMPGGATTQSITVSPTATTTYTVTGTNNCTGVSSSATSTVTIISNPVINNSVPTFCSGGSSTLTASGGGGTYFWSPSTGLSGTTGVQVIANPTVTTTYSLTLNNGCYSSTTVTVKPASISVSPIVSYIYNGCFAAVNAGGADTYTWTPPATIALNSDKTFASVWANATTTYTVSGSSSCFTKSNATFTVYVVPPVVVNSATVCSGNSVTLTASGANSYSWSTGTLTNTVTVSPASTTTYTVTGTNSAGCSNKAVATVTVPIPSLTITPGSVTICTGTTTTLTASGLNAYNWSTGATTSSIAVSPTSNTSYTVTGIDIKGCSNKVIATVTVDLNPPIISSIISPSQNWSALTSGTTNNLLGVSAPSSSIAYVCGGGGTILRTTDGGATWISQSTGTTNNLCSICFTDTNTGYVVGSNQTVITTTNGGATWNPITLPPVSGTTFNFTSIYFLNANIGYITGSEIYGFGGGIIYQTINGGASWTINYRSATTGSWPHITSGKPFYGTYFLNPLTGYAVGGSGTILKTTNGGVSWSSLANPTQPGVAGASILLTSVFFTDVNTGYCTGNNNSTYTNLHLKTNNAGATWAQQIDTTAVFTSIKFLDTSIGFLIGGNVNNNTPTVLKTMDAGATWISETLPGNYSRFSGADFYGLDIGYAVGLNGNIFKYSAQKSISVCSGTNVTLNGTGNGTTYSWSGGVTNGVAYTPAATATYTVTSTNGCGSSNASATVVVNTCNSVSATVRSSVPTTGSSKELILEDTAATDIFVMYPNPTNGNVTLNYTLQLTDRGEIRMYNMDGREISNYKLDNSANRLVIYNDQLNSGIYIYTITVNGNAVKRDKIIIMK